MIINEILLGGGTWQEALMASLKDLIDAALAKAKLDAHPVGSYYWSSEATDPGTLFGGTWEQIKDRFVYAVGDGSAAGDVGGEATHTLTEAEMPKHYHDSLRFREPDRAKFGCNSEGSLADTSWTIPWVEGKSKDYYVTGYTGGSQAHNNLPPFIRAFCWRRTA